MGFGPFLSQEEKNNINNSLQQNYAPKMGPPIPKVQVPTGGRSAIRAEERRRSREAAKTPFVPSASASSASTRQGGRARVKGGVQIGVPQSSPISTQRPNRSSSTTTETPTQNPTRPVDTAGAEVAALTGKNYTVGGVEYDYSTGQAINPDTGKTSSGGYSIDPKNSQRTDYSRGQTRTNANGVTQTGTQTSPSAMTMDDANKLLTGGYTMNQQYASNQLPYTQSSPYAGKGNAEIYNQETLQQFNGDVDNVKLANDLFGGKSGVEKAKPSFQMGSDFKPMDAYGKGQTPDNYNVGEPLGKAGEPAESGKTDWLNRSAADNSDAKMARRRAFLDGADSGVGSMQALRRSEAVQGMTYAGGQHYIADGKGGDSLTAIGDKQDVRTYKSSEEGARQMRDKYVNALTSKDDSPASLPDSEQQASTVETSSNQKPLTVAPNDIPSDLSGAAGQEYLRKLDAGQLTRMR